MGEEKERGSITVFIEEKVEARSQFLTDIKEFMWRNDAMNDPWVKKAPGGTFTLLNSRKFKYKVQIQGKLDFIISTAQNYFLESLFYLYNSKPRTGPFLQKC